MCRRRGPGAALSGRSHWGEPGAGARARLAAAGDPDALHGAAEPAGGRAAAWHDADARLPPGEAGVIPAAVRAAGRLARACGEACVRKSRSEAMEIQRILVPVDGSALSLRAVEAA